MINHINICWSKTKKNVENVINKYVYYNLSVDNNSTSCISEDFLLSELIIDGKNSIYLKLGLEEKKKRIEFINYVRFSFNKLTTDERKIIYWTYLDK